MYKRHNKKKINRSVLKKEDIDYKNLKMLINHTMEVGKIIPSRITSNTTKNQRLLSKEIKIARYLGLIKYCDNHK